MNCVNTDFSSLNDQKMSADPPCPIIYPFRRPWLYQNGAAAAANQHQGIKGIFAGGITGGINIFLTYPTEYLKTQLQLDGKGADKKFDGVVDCFKKTVQSRGIFGLYRGLSGLIYGTIPKNAVRFGSFETCKGIMLDSDDRLGPIGKILCGMGAGICEAILVVTPMETVKVKFINDIRSDKPRYKGYLHGVGLIIKEHGMGGVYKGVVATVMKQGSNQSMRFFTMETLKDLYKGDDKDKHVPKYMVGLFGMIAAFTDGYNDGKQDPLGKQGSTYTPAISTENIRIVGSVVQRILINRVRFSTPRHADFSSQQTQNMSQPPPFVYPFSRPWLHHNGAAAAAGGSNKGVKGVVAGAITGGIEICITFPTEYVKTQLQLDEKGAAKKYDGIVDCVKKTVQSRGVFGLYRGLSVLLYGSIPKSAVRFGAFETFKGFMQSEDGTLSPGGRMLCGLGAGVCEAIFAVTPMETVKVKFINDQRSEKPRFKGFFHGVGVIVKEQGIGGVYKGLTATIMKQGSNQAIRFFTMETLKDLYKGDDKKKHVPKYMVGIFGVIAGAASVYGNTPIDVVKTRMQGLEASKYKSTLDCAIQIWKNEGPRAFYKGTVPRLSRVCLDVAITFMIYDSFMDLFNQVWP